MQATIQQNLNMLARHNVPVWHKAEKPATIATCGYTPYKLGVEAAQTGGFTENDNPFRLGTEAYDDWAIGFAELEIA